MELWIQSLLLFYVEWLTICQVPVLFATWNWSLFLFGVYFHLGCVILFILSVHSICSPVIFLSPLYWFSYALPFPCRMFSSFPRLSVYPLV
jgi:hypothetical protein